MRYASVDAVRKKVTGCTKCALYKTRTNSVPGKGDARSRVIFIGEAPGRSEDKRGEPFVGSAGKRLTQALEAAGIPRESVYITNTVKCRPPENRVPTDGERAACAPYLESEIRLINPRIICIMGNTAFGTLLGGKDVTKHSGSIVRRDGRDYFITIHPAATIYNQKLIPILERDMKRLAGILDAG